jgi:hypothetical protein
MNLKRKILFSCDNAPDRSGSPAERKAIFSRHSKATSGSSCCGCRKKALLTMAKAKSRTRHKKIENRRITGNLREQKCREASGAGHDVQRQTKIGVCNT